MPLRRWRPPFRLIVARLFASYEYVCARLQVFVKNPLYKWACDPTKPQPAAPPTHPGTDTGDGGGTSTQHNREAERALLRIQDKLAGRMAGTHEALAVEGQVRALLDEARAPENLCRMFDGWAAWL